jgi:hypothetical protein
MQFLKYSKIEHSGQEKNLCLGMIKKAEDYSIWTRNTVGRKTEDAVKKNKNKLLKNAHFDGRRYYA